MEIRQLREEGLYYAQISRELGIDPRTVAKYCKEEPVGSEKRAAPGILDEYKEFIIARMDEGIINAVVMARKLRELGYKGSMSTLRAFMAPLRAKHRDCPVMRFETGPGEQMQIDWGEFGTITHNGKRRKLHCFVATLCYSRYMYAEFTVSESRDTLLECHKHAFDYFGGFTKEILYDNMATVVRIAASGEKVINPRFSGFAKMMGFTPRFCRVRRPQTKGKIESGVRYVKHNFWQGISFTDLKDLNRLLRLWLIEANARMHGTTYRVPLEVLAEEKLIPLLDTVPFVLAADPGRTVGRDCLLSYRSSKYSVPWQYASKRVAVIESDSEIRVFCEGELIAEHPRAQEKHSVIMNPEHYKGIPRDRKQEVLGGRQVLAPDDAFYEVQKRPLDHYDHLEGGDF